MKRFVSHISLWVLLCLLGGSVPAARTVEFETTQVTAPDVAISPDGEWLIFTMLGHLFRLSVEGGIAEQLTFGPYYDSEPLFSPGGSRVAFVSDRDGSEGNVFVLELASGEITQITHEPWVGRPTWSPDGQTIVYLGFMIEAAGFNGVPALIRQIHLSGGEPETLSAPPRLLRSVFHLPDGRLGWTVAEQEPQSPRWTTRIEVMGPQGAVSTLRTLEGITSRVVPSPTGDGLYCRRSVPGESPMRPQRTELLFLPLPNGSEKQLLRVSNPMGGWSRWRPRFAVAADNKRLYLGEGGRLWKMELPLGTREPISFSAPVKLEVHDPLPPPKPVLIPAGRSAPPRGVLDPRLSPGSHMLVFAAAGYLWQQPLDGDGAQRLFEGSAFERDPAFSPDGRHLAFVHTEYAREQVRVFNFESRQTRTLASGLSYWNLGWSPDGQRLIFVEREDSTSPPTSRVVAVTISDGEKEELIGISWWWGSRPHFSADGRWLYFVGPPGAGTLYRLSLKEKAEPKAVRKLHHPISRALVSPDGKWLVFPRNGEIWMAPMGAKTIDEDDAHQLSPQGGDSFAFTPGGSELIYAAGNRVWRHRLDGGKRQELPIHLELQRPVPPPLLVQRVRVLDFDAGAFGPETSLFIEQGQIFWVGLQRDCPLPEDTVIVDAGGRFAIPGLFDLHVHTLGGANEYAYLAYGVTSVRDTGSGLAWLNDLADRSEATADPLPRYFFAGAMFEGALPARPSFPIRLMIQNEEEARAYVLREKEQGVHFIKVHPPSLWTLQRAIAEEARRQGLPVVGHGLSVEEITKSVTLGYWSLEHSPYLSYDDVLQMLAATGTRCVPTLPVKGYHDLLLRDEPERLKDAKLRAFTPEWWIRHSQMGGFRRSIGTKTLRGSFTEDLASIGAAHRWGVKLHVGTDLEPWGWNFFYGAVHWELEFFVQAGLTPLEVLRIATQEAAAAVGADNDLGTLEVGKLADIVLLDANPLEDIRNTQIIWRVIKGGWVFDPEKLRPPESDGTTE